MRPITSERTNQGILLTEVLVATALLAVIGMGLSRLLSSSAQAAACATEHQTASVVAARAMDRFRAAGFRTLRGLAGRELELDLSWIDAASEVSPPVPKTVVAGEMRITGSTLIELLEDDLLIVRLTLAWTSGRRARTGALTVFRYVADPAAGARVAGGGRA